MAKKEDTQPATPSTTTKLWAPDGVTGCSVNGNEYEVAEDGTVEVENEAVPQLIDHGFVTSKPKAK